jgi:hypothetical protein
MNSKEDEHIKGDCNACFKPTNELCFQPDAKFCYQLDDSDIDFADDFMKKYANRSTFRYKRVRTRDCYNFSCGVCLKILIYAEKNKLDVLKSIAITSHEEHIVAVYRR